VVTVAVQAGGRSSRMGRDKALIPLAGIPLIEHVLSRAKGLGDELLVTTNRPDDYAYLGVRMAQDREPGAGSLHGLLTALEAAQGKTVLVLACDMPFLSRPLLEHLVGLADQASVVIPRRGGEFEPLHAVYSRSCVNPIREALLAGQRRVTAILSRVPHLIVGDDTLMGFDPDGWSFFNINTPRDLARAEQILTESPAGP